MEALKNHDKTKPPVIEVEDYYDKVHRGAWIRRSCGLMAGVAFGICVAGAIGLVAPFVPYVLGAIGVAGAAPITFGAAAAGVANSFALFASTGALMGMAAIATVGSDAGAVSSGLLEKEKREKLDKLNNSTSASITQADVKLLPSQNKPPKIFDWKVAVFTVPIVAAFGVLLSLNPLTFGVGMALTGLQAGTTAATVAAASIFGMFGAIFAAPVSVITNKFNNFFLKIMTGKMIGKEETPGTQIEKQLNSAEIPKNHAPDLALAESAPAKIFTSEKKPFSLQAILDKTDHHADGHMMINR